MRKFEPKDVVKVFGSEGQFLCYGVVKDDELAKTYPHPYYSVAIVRNYPTVTNEQIYGFGGICVKEDEVEKVR